MKNLRSATFGSKDIVIIKLEFVAKTQFLSIDNQHSISLFKNFCYIFCRSYWLIEKKTILKIISSEWTMKEDFKNWICTLAEQICNVKTSDKSKITPKNITAFSVQLPCIAGHSLSGIYKFISIYSCSYKVLRVPLWISEKLIES